MAKLVDTNLNGSLIIKPSTQSSNQLEFSSLGIQNNMDDNNLESVFNIGSKTNPFGSFYGKGFSSNIQGYQYGHLRPYIIGTTEKVGQGRLTLGNPILKGNAGNARGLLFLYGENDSGTFITTLNNKSGEQYNNIQFPNKSGVVALEGHTHGFQTTELVFNGITKAKNATKETYKSGTGKILPTVKQNGIYNTQASDGYGNVTLKNCYGWGSDVLDVFVVRGYIELKVTTEVPANTRIRVGCIRSKKSNMLPGYLTPLSVYTYKDNGLRGMMTYSRQTPENDGYVNLSYLDFRFTNKLVKGTTYNIYFTATYGKIGKSLTEEEIEDIE